MYSRSEAELHLDSFVNTETAPRSGGKDAFSSSLLVCSEPTKGGNASILTQITQLEYDEMDKPRSLPIISAEKFNYDAGLSIPKKQFFPTASQRREQEMDGHSTAVLAMETSLQKGNVQASVDTFKDRFSRLSSALRENKQTSAMVEKFSNAPSFSGRLEKTGAESNDDSSFDLAPRWNSSATATSESSSSSSPFSPSELKNKNLLQVASKHTVQLVPANKIGESMDGQKKTVNTVFVATEIVSTRELKNNGLSQEKHTRTKRMEEEEGWIEKKQHITTTNASPFPQCKEITSFFPTSTPSASCASSADTSRLNKSTKQLKVEESPPALVPFLPKSTVISGYFYHATLSAASVKYGGPVSLSTLWNVLQTALQRLPNCPTAPSRDHNGADPEERAKAVCAQDAYAIGRTLLSLQCVLERGFPAQKNQEKLYQNSNECRFLAGFSEERFFYRGKILCNELLCPVDVFRTLVLNVLITLEDGDLPLEQRREYIWTQNMEKMLRSAGATAPLSDASAGLTDEVGQIFSTAVRWEKCHTHNLRVLTNRFRGRYAEALFKVLQNVQKFQLIDYSKSPEASSMDEKGVRSHLTGQTIYTRDAVLVAFTASKIPFSTANMNGATDEMNSAPKLSSLDEVIAAGAAEERETPPRVLVLERCWFTHVLRYVGYVRFAKFLFFESVHFWILHRELTQRERKCYWKLCDSPEFSRFCDSLAKYYYLYTLGLHEALVGSSPTDSSSFSSSSSSTMTME
jgi:hypothetical protein